MRKSAEGPVYEAMFIQWCEARSAVDISTTEGLEDAVDRFFASEGISANKQDLIDSVTRNQVPRPGAFVLGQKSSEFIPSVFRHVSQVVETCGGCFKSTWDQISDNYIRVVHPTEVSYNVHKDLLAIDEINRATMDTLQSGQGSPCSRHNNV